MRTTSGVVAGAVANGVVSWKGIPFAAPPVGDLRWRAPQPVAPWTGVRAATEYAHDCMQQPFPSDAAPLGTPPAEDCLVRQRLGPGEAGLREAARDGLDPRRRLRERRQLARGLRRQRLRAPRRRASSASTTASAASASSPTPRSRRRARTSPSATTGSSTRSRRCAGCRTTSRPSAATPATSRSSASRRAAAPSTRSSSRPSRAGLFHKAIVQSGGGRAGGLIPCAPSASAAQAEPSAEAVGVAFAKSAGVTGDDAAALAALRKLPAARPRRRHEPDDRPAARHLRGADGRREDRPRGGRARVPRGPAGEGPVHDRGQQPRVRLHAAAAGARRRHVGPLRRRQGRGAGAPTTPRRRATRARSGSAS